MSDGGGSTKPIWLSWLALMALLAATTAGAYAPLGSINVVLSLAIAAAKVAIIMAVFMKLWGKPRLTWAFAGAGFFWLLILIGLTTNDYLTRTVALVGPDTALRSSAVAPRR